MDGAALMKIVMIQMEVDSGQKDRNIRHAFQLLEQAVPNSDVLVLPELWTIGYDFHNLDKNATRLGDSLISGLSSFANYHHVTLEAGTLPVEVNGKISNMGIVFGPNGEIQAQYSKRHLFYGYEESKLMVPGNSLMNTEINGVKTGMAVCYEFYFPRMWRKMAKSGVTLVLAPASWPAVHIPQWEVLTRARAIENGICVCAVNMAGEYHGLKLGGHSLFIDPTGKVEAEAGDGEEILYGEYDEIRYRDLGKQLAVIRL